MLAVSRSQDNLDRHIAPWRRRVGGRPRGWPTPRPTRASRPSWRRAPRTDSSRSGQRRRRRRAETWMPSTRVSRQAWRELFTANLETMFFMSQAVAAELRAQRLPGSIVSLSSISGMNTAPYHVAYGTAKAAVVAATRTMAVELAAGRHPGQRRRPRRHRDPASGTYTDDDLSAICAPSRWAPRPARRTGRRHPVPAVRPVELHHRPDPVGRRRSEPADASRWGQHVTVPERRELPDSHH